MLTINSAQRGEELIELFDTIVPLDTLPSILVRHYPPKSSKRPPLLHYGFPPTEPMMTAICAMGGYKEEVEHLVYGKFCPTKIYAVGS